MKRWVLIAATLGVLAASAPGYYHYIHYASRTAPYSLVPEKFDLAALHNKTLYFYVSDSGPEAMAEGDSFAALLSQLQRAGRIWSEVETSDLRVEYGGLFTPGTPQSTPRMEILFDDTPGVIAMGGPTSRAEPVEGPNGRFVPITGSVMILNRDLSGRPSYDALAMTIVHEMGHALGLQHSLSSGMMSTEVTRASTPASPLGPDDVAAISLLYPNERFAANYGSLTGRVSMSGNGVHLASVVAVTNVGQAVSTLTAPDGTYRIDGLRPAQYYVYAHALPPSVQPELGPSEIVLPKDPDGQPVPAGGTFRTQFYPGTSVPQEAQMVGVSAGQTTSGIDFEVEQRGSPELHSITTWSFPGQKAVQSAYVNSGVPAQWFLVAAGPGLMPNGAPAPGMDVSVLGRDVRVAPGGVYPYSMSPQHYLQINFQFTPFTVAGPRQLVFSAGDELYVLPAGLNVVKRYPPSITAVTAEVDEAGNRVAVIEGTGFRARTRILFDGLEAQVLGVDEAGGRIVVSPPPGPPGHRAHVQALNPDGQSSFFVDQPLTYTYEGPEEEEPYIVLSTASLPAGSEAMIEVEGVNTHFEPGHTRLGFGSSDVVVKGLWVLSPTRLRANVAVAANAPPASTLVSATTGFRVMSRPFAFEIQPADPQQVAVNSSLVNPETNDSWVYPGSLASVLVWNVLPEQGAQVTLNDVPVTVVETADGRITFQVPPDMAPGTAVLRVESGGRTSFPVIVRIDLPPPVVNAVLLRGGSPLDAGSGVRPGEVLVVRVSGLDPAEWIDPERVRVNVGGIDHLPFGLVQPDENQPGAHVITIVLSKDTPAGQQPLVVKIDNRASGVVAIPVAAVPEG